MVQQKRGRGGRGRGRGRSSASGGAGQAKYVIVKKVGGGGMVVHRTNVVEGEG